MARGMQLFLITSSNGIRYPWASSSSRYKSAGTALVASSMTASKLR